jgi:hypothetical protein
MQTVTRQRTSKHVPAATNMNIKIEILLERCFLLDSCKVVIRKTIGAMQLVVSCRLNSALEAVKTEPECVKLKNLRC